MKIIMIQLREVHEEKHRNIIVLYIFVCNLIIQLGLVIKTKTIIFIDRCHFSVIILTHGSNCLEHIILFHEK